MSNETTANETKQKEFNTKLANVNSVYFPMIERQLEGHSIKMDDYAKRCVLSAIGAINSVMQSKGIDWNDPQLDTSNITNTLISVATLKLNPCATPREIYFQTRNVSIKGEWKKQIEMGIEGDGNDALLARYGRDVKKVGKFWLVKENDIFEYPQFNVYIDGKLQEYIPPKWIPKGSGKVVRVVYPVMKTDGTVEHYIAERDEVVPNLIAHVNNNLMNETFGLCKDRKNATPEEKKKIKAKKNEIFKKIESMGLDALDDPELSEYMSPSWTDYHSRESMLIRKMRNNIVKKIPKDFGSYLVQEKYNETVDETYREVKEEVAENANKEVINLSDYAVIDQEPTPAPTPTTQPEYDGSQENINTPVTESESIEESEPTHDDSVDTKGSDDDLDF